MKALNFEALLAGNDLTPMQRLLCELMQQKGKTLCASHFAPVSTGDRQTERESVFIGTRTVSIAIKRICLLAYQHGGYRPLAPAVPR